MQPHLYMYKRSCLQCTVQEVVVVVAVRASWTAGATEGDSCWSRSPQGGPAGGGHNRVLWALAACGCPFHTHTGQ